MRNYKEGLLTKEYYYGTSSTVLRCKQKDETTKSSTTYNFHFIPNTLKQATIMLLCNTVNNTFEFHNKAGIA